MPQLANPRLVSQLQRITEDHSYVDAGYYISQPSLSTLDSYGHPTTAGTSTAVSCSFTDKPSAERWQAFADISELDGEVRFSSVTPQKGGHFQLTERFGETVTTQTFEIVGVQDRGVFGFVCALKAVAI